MKKILFIWLVFSLSIGSELPDDWPMFKHDLQHTGSALCAAPDTTHLLWEYDAKAPIAASPVVVNGTVFLTARGKMVALQAETGNVIWSQEIPVMGSTPAVSGGTIVVGTKTGFAALNSQTGELLWEQLIWESYLNSEHHPYKEFFVSSPLVVGNKVYVGTGTNLRPDPFVSHAEEENLRQLLRYVICMDIESGEILWKMYVNGYANSSPAFSDNILYVNEASFYALDPDSGNVHWRFNHGYSVGMSPVIVNDSIILTVQDDYGESKVLRIRKGDVIWEKEFEKAIASTPAVSQEEVVVITVRGDISVLDLESGEIIWAKSLGGEYLENTWSIIASPCSPAIADGKIYVGTVNGMFSCLELETGDVLWQYQTEGAILASPAVAYEMVFVASTDGKLYCFGIDPETYFQKAEKYEEHGDTERAREFYKRARDYYESQGNLEMVKQCEKKLDGRRYPWIAVIVVGCMIICAMVVYWKMHKSNKSR